METEGCEGQRVVLAGWGALGSVQILHKHLLELYGQRCDGWEGGSDCYGGFLRGLMVEWWCWPE